MMVVMMMRACVRVCVKRVPSCRGALSVVLFPAAQGGAATPM